MIITATQKNTRQTALKVRLVANQVKKLSLANAIAQLGVIQKKSTLVILKVIRQAIANAMHNHGYTLEELTLKNITVAPGQTYKRFRAVSRGRAHTIFKRSCHVSVELEAGVARKVVSEKKASKKEAAQVEKTVESSTAPAEKSAPKKAVKKIAKKVTTKKA